MKAVTLERIDPAQNMSLLQARCAANAVRRMGYDKEWGRIGRGGTVRSSLYGTSEEAEAACDKQCRAKERRGYRPQ